MYRKRLIKHTIAALIIIIVTVAAEFFIFNANAFKGTYTEVYRQKSSGNSGFAVRPYSGEFLSDKDDETDDAAEEETDDESYESDAERAAVLVFDEKYISKMSIEFDSDEKFEYEIELSTINKFGSEAKKEISDKYYPEIGRTYLNIGSRVVKVKVIYPDDVKIKSITLSNEFNVSVVRMLFVAFSLGLMYSFFTCRRLVSEKIEYGFLLTAVLLGSIMVLALPEDFRSWDEHIHFNRAYMYSFGNTVEYTEAALRLKNLDVPEIDTREDRIAVSRLLNSEDSEVVQEVEKSNGFISYGGRAYIPQSFALWFARSCGLGLTTGMILARYMNLFVYVLFMFLAIKYAKHGKRILTLIGLMPTSLFLASSFSYDAFVSAFVTFGFVMIINEFAHSEDKVDWRRILAGVTGMVVGCFAKAVYIPLILITCFIPKEKFENNKQKWMFRISIVIVFLVMMSTFVLPALTNATSGVDAGGDARGGDTSVTRQLASVMSHPVEYAELLTGTIIKTAPDYFLGHASRTFFAYLGGNAGTLFYISLIITVFVAFTEGTMEDHLPLARKTKLALGAIIMCVIALIWTALYLDFTPVGMNKIKGVQPRYYIPLMFPVVLLIENGRVRCHRVSEFRYNQIVLYAGVIVLSGMIYEYILKACCI